MHECMCRVYLCMRDRIYVFIFMHVCMLCVYIWYVCIYLCTYVFYGCKCVCSVCNNICVLGYVFLRVCL